MLPFELVVLLLFFSKNSKRILCLYSNARRPIARKWPLTSCARLALITLGRLLQGASKTLQLDDRSKWGPALAPLTRVNILLNNTLWLPLLLLLDRAIKQVAKIGRTLWPDDDGNHHHHHHHQHVGSHFVLGPQSCCHWNYAPRSSSARLAWLLGCCVRAQFMEQVCCLFLSMVCIKPSFGRLCVH